MPCPPSWEERMVMEGESAYKRLNSEYPELKKRYAQISDIFERLNLDLPSKLTFEEQIPEKPKITENDWPSYEDGEVMEKYSKEILALFLKLELWLCETSTLLALAMDNQNTPIEASLAEKINLQIEFHKKHREEDRKESANKLRQQITWYRLALTLEKYENEVQKNNFIFEKQKLEEKLEILLSYSIDQLIRDRSLTNI